MGNFQQQKIVHSQTVIHLPGEIIQTSNEVTTLFKGLIKGASIKTDIKK